MSLRYQQYNALKKTKDLLKEILSNKELDINELVRKTNECLNHFPPLNENGKPYFSYDEFTSEEGEQL